MRKQSGFTLIEVMIVVVIIGILASIAFPNYQEYVIRSNRAEGQALLVDAAARQERYFAQNYTYVDNDNLSKLSMNANSANGHYTLVITSADKSSYALTAQAQGAQASRDTKCGNLTLNSAGERGKSGSGSVTDCWK